MKRRLFDAGAEALKHSRSVGYFTRHSRDGELLTCGGGSDLLTCGGGSDFVSCCNSLIRALNWDDVLNFYLRFDKVF